MRKREKTGKNIRLKDFVSCCSLCFHNFISLFFKACRKRRISLERIAAFAICLLIFGINAYAAAIVVKPTPARLYGEYRGAGCPSATGQTACVPTKKTDRVTISRGKAGKASVSVEIVFDAGHVCMIAGQAVWSNNRFVLNAEGIDAQKSCRLEARISGSILTLADAEGACREVYCGVRGALHGARFRKIR